MHLQLTPEQDALRDAVARFLDKASSPEAVRAAEPLGWDGAVWAGLADMGVPALGVPEAAGGSGASLRDLAVVAEACGAHLAPAPVVEAMVAARLLAGCGEPAADVLATLAEGGPPVTLALHPAVDGIARLVPGAAVAAAVVALDGDDLVLVAQDDLPTSPANLGSAPLADVDLRAGTTTVLRSGADAVGAHAAAVDEWRALTGRWLVGLGREAQAIGVQYAKDRKQFDVPVGSFQAVQHRFADLATDLDGADLLANKAVWALDVGDPVAASFPAMALWFAGDTAQRAASWGLHVHGGYGFMEEYDIQLHFRRAKATRLLLGDPRRELQLLADRLWADPAVGPIPGSTHRPTAPDEAVERDRAPS
ncbi:MAG TPA: acyl-CoA dehydrogenase family protein, partial [Aquihabitans sp.]|nr:acyl-CoA dehydrogenase family protein [Aquihabitans sp.]